MAVEAIQRNEQLRWYLLLALHSGRPGLIRESILLRTLQGVGLFVSQLELRRELDYLQRSQLAHLRRRSSTWLAELTRCGTDVTEYTVPCQLGIARPPKYW